MTASLALLFSAIVAVESGGNPNAVGDNGRAVGPAQIWEITVRDVNRIAGTRYTLADRRDLTKAAEMFRIYTDFYGARYGYPITDETRARIWNGGPNGPRNKRATDRYWQKVRKAHSTISASVGR
jgi:hypothetical protein